MDPSHSHAVFIEITFGLNTVFTAYKEFSDLVNRLVDNKIEEFVSRAKIIEEKSPDRNAQRLETVQTQLSAYQKEHIRLQSWLRWIVVGLAVLCALAALVILYFDHVAAVGYWCGLLVLPLLGYLAFSIGNYWIFLFRGNGKLKRLKSYHREFDPPDLPPPPNGDVVGK
jgi:hypothetical protein